MNGSAEVKSITRRLDGAFCITAGVKNDSGQENIEFILLPTLFDKLEPRLGEIDVDFLDSLDYCASVSAAYLSACASLAYTQCSLKALCKKLVMKGFSKDVSLDATAIIQEQGFIDEDTIAARRTEIMLSKLWGRSKIIQKLREEGFSESTLTHAVQLLQDVDFCENCLRLIEEKYAIAPCERRERDKMYASLLRMGYSQSEIRAAIRSLSQNE